MSNPAVITESSPIVDTASHTEELYKNIDSQLAALGIKPEEETKPILEQEINVDAETMPKEYNPDNSPLGNLPEAVTSTVKQEVEDLIEPKGNFVGSGNSSQPEHILEARIRAQNPSKDVTQ